jgi:uracil-DNA glycosylase
MNIDVEESPAKQLWREMYSAMPPFPKGVVEVPELITGTAFFPGGLGLWMEGRISPGKFPTEQIMVVGQDFNSSATYDRVRVLGTEVGTSATWRNLRGILSAAGVSLDRCFFTNLYMGLRDGGTETGKFPGARDKDFVRRCLDFLNLQLQVARPKLILTLGLEPLQGLAAAIPGLPAPKTLSSCAEIYRSVPLAHGGTAIVALTHPSFYYANVWRRRYATFVGAGAEQAMIRAGLVAAFGSNPTIDRD